MEVIVKHNAKTDQGTAPMRAYPIREGVIVMNGKEEIAWQDHLWNTGEVTRSWFLKPETLGVSRIRERDLQPSVPDQ